MANPKVKFKRSSVANKRPSLDNIELGELALNTYDGKLFTRQDTGGVGIATTVTLVNPWTESYGGGTISYSGVVTATSFSGDGSNLTGISAGAPVSISTVAPSSPSAGDLWFDPNYGRTVVYYDEATVGYGTSKYWIDPSPVDTDNITIIAPSNLTVSGIVTATSFVKSGGTSSQFLKADGSVDSSTYITSADGGNADQLDGQEGTYYLNYNNFTNTPTIPTNNNELTNGAGYITSADGGNAATLDSLDSTQFLRSDAADTKTSGDLTFSDDVKLKLGTGSDLQIYHDGTNSTITNTTGDLYITDSGGNIYIQSKAGEQSIVAFADGAVDLYHNNSKKLETTSSGVSVTGNVTISDKIIHSGDTNTAIRFPSNDTVSVETAGSERVRIDASGNTSINTTTASSFNGVGAGHKLVVAGSTSDTDITDNSDAAITISNKDGTANNTAGLHFAREDNDGTPHYSGASVVAQFKETQVTGQYPKAELAFLTSTAANNAPSEKLRIGSAGQIGLGGANYGTSGQVLTSNGSSSAPTWQDAGGGAWNLVSTVTASDVAAVEFTNAINNSYKQYVLVATEVWTDSGQTTNRCRIRFKDGSSQVSDSNYFYTVNQVYNGTGPNRAAGVNQNAMLLVNQSQASNVNPRYPLNFNMWIMGGNRDDYVHQVYWTGGMYSNTNQYVSFQGMGGIHYSQANTFIANGLKIYLENGNFYGTFKLYGLA